MWRSEHELREETRWLVNRALNALGLADLPLAGCSEAEIERIRAAQGVDFLPASFSEFLSLVGCETDPSVLSAMIPGHGMGVETLRRAKEFAVDTAKHAGADEVLGIWR